jgi:outer membrane protein TolC
MLRQVLADSERALALAQTSYRVGSGDLRAVQQQQLGALAARLALLRVQSEQLSQRVNLHLALGGSFEHPASPESEMTAAIQPGPVQSGQHR